MSAITAQSPISPLSREYPRVFDFDDEMAPPQRPIERMSSHPSLTHSYTTTATSDENHDYHQPGDLLTPIDNSFGRGSMDDAEEVLSPVAEKRGLRLGLTKSMQSLRGRARADRERDSRSRSSSRDQPPMPVMEIPVKSAHYVRSNQPIPRSSEAAPIAIKAPLPPTQTSKSKRPEVQRSNSSFSSFIRKLTGKASKPESPVFQTASPQYHYAPPARSASVRPQSNDDRNMGTRSSLAIDTRVQETKRPLVSRKGSLPVEPRQAYTPVYEAAPVTAPLVVAPILEGVAVDPRAVPLPPSPPSPAIALPNGQDEEGGIDFSLSRPSVQPGLGETSPEPEHTSQTIRQVGLLRLEPLKPERVEEEEEDDQEGSDESTDLVLPLRALRIPSKSGMSLLSNSPGTASTSNESDLNTPIEASILSMGEITRERDETDAEAVIRAARGSPPKQRGSSPVAVPGLIRKESKWRKSVMNLSDSLNGQSKRVVKPPPSSHDAYLAHQKRMANHRRSCAPTLHSTASIAAETIEIADKEQQEMAEVFFLS